MTNTTIKIDQVQKNIQPLFYGDVIRVNDEYFLIIQSDNATLILIELTTGIFEWNRSLDPVEIDSWPDLNTNNICNYVQEFSGKKIQKVNATITINIKANE